MTDTRGTDMAGPNATHDASASDLVKQLSEQTRRLVQHEMELAKAELTEKGKQAGVGAGLLGGGGVFALYALGALTATLIAALSLAMETWLAALIVTVIWAAVAGVMALLGKARVQKSAPPIPEQSVESVKEDVQWTKTSAQRGRR
ncbi:MAG TPA: phage holin family protein [Solirubrobacteraceae bacterium]|nr:phage holin family protein [Solirubrobacteraceae bacterium]